MDVRRLLWVAVALLLACLLPGTSPSRAVSPPGPTVTSPRPPIAAVAGAPQPLLSLSFQQGLLPDPAYNGVQDTYLDLWGVDETRYSEEAIVLRSDGAQRALLKFDLSNYVPVGSEIVQATLYLWTYYANPYSSVIEAGAHRVLTAWQESTCTWNSPWSLAGCDEPTDRETEANFVANVREPGLWVWWDVTAAAQTWALNPALNQGMLIVCPPGQPQRRVQFRSSEFADAQQRPKLVVQYHAAGEPTPTATSTVTPTPTTAPGNCNLLGLVTLQRPGQPAPHASWVVTITVSAGGAEHNLSTDLAGSFVLSGLSPGTYDIGIKNAHTLRNVRRNVALLSGDNVVDFGILREGDANDDNCVNITDFSIFAGAFAAASGAQADFDHDGHVNITDFSLLASSFGQCGD